MIFPPYTSKNGYAASNSGITSARVGQRKCVIGCNNFAHLNILVHAIVNEAYKSCTRVLLHVLLQARAHLQ